jgi:pimeloyl-ACP methyl ester carboxylesterase
MNESIQRGYAPINGLAMYYEVHGDVHSAGSPLVLLHGGFLTIELLRPLLPALARSRQVIAVELEGHGHTVDLDRPLSFEQMADDVAALIAHRGLERADCFGYSLGGGVALQIAIRHPEVVRKLVAVSAPYQTDGWYPEVRAGMASITADMMATTPLYDAYLKAAPNPERWPGLVSKMQHLLGEERYDWAAGVAAITAPTLLVIGDADSVRLAHIVEMYALLGGGLQDVGMGPPPQSQLAVLPGTTHLSIIARTDLLLPVVMSFLDAPAAL